MQNINEDVLQKLCDSTLFNQNLPIAFESSVSSFAISDSDENAFITRGEFLSLVMKTLKIDYNVKNTGAGEMFFAIGSHEAYYTPEGIEDYDVIFSEPQTLDATQIFGKYLGDEKLPIIKDSTVLPLYEKYFIIDALVFEDIKFSSAVLKNRKTGRRPDNNPTGNRGTG